MPPSPMSRPGPSSAPASARWTALAAALPTAMGAALCMIIHGVWTLLG